MQVHKLTTTDGFIAFDLGDAPAIGVVRVAPKVLRDGAELLARSTTYLAASFGLKVGGGSAGLNAKPEVRDEALAALRSADAALRAALESVFRLPKMASPPGTYAWPPVRGLPAVGGSAAVAGGKARSQARREEELAARR